MTWPSGRRYEGDFVRGTPHRQGHPDLPRRPGVHGRLRGRRADRPGGDDPAGRQAAGGKIRQRGIRRAVTGMKKSTRRKSAPRRATFFLTPRGGILCIQR
ncbi:MAG: hypothetical protein MZV70_60415 [Desulfobacterales bacterium]|nr:hypothetical protein [Desulfobacterales bacterium]